MIRPYQWFGGAIAAVALFGIGAGVAAWTDGPPPSAAPPLTTFRTVLSATTRTATQTATRTALRRVRVLRRVTLPGGTQLVTETLPGGVVTRTVVVTSTRVLTLPARTVTMTVPGPTTTETVTVTTVPTT